MKNIFPFDAAIFGSFTDHGPSAAATVSALASANDTTTFLPATIRFVVLLMPSQTDWPVPLY